MARVLPLTPENIAEAARALKAGELVAFPSETVYGLGADATNDRAVAAIFAAKGRPRFNPLIVHVPDAEAARHIAALPPVAERLAARFWPGALSLVAPRRAASGLSLLVSAGLDTVAIRVPAHEGARSLLRVAGIPVAAPSANVSGRISSTTAQHVVAELGDHVAIILDGGPCAIGLESTVLDTTGTPPALLRGGGVTAEDVESFLGLTLMLAGSEDNAPKSPGMLTSHYAPARHLRMNAVTAASGEALLGFGPAPEAVKNLSVTGDLTEAAANLFASLRLLDTPPWTGIAVMKIPETGLGRAINDRLRRAAAPRG
ncbi:MAG: L-threonylcarbamoyladenylate synthase [Alphaproteobacteria bacterium]